MTRAERMLDISGVPGIDNRIKAVSFVVTTREMERIKQMRFESAGTDKLFKVRFAPFGHTGSFRYCSVIDANVNDSTEFLPEEFCSMVADQVDWLLPEVACELRDLSKDWEEDMNEE